MRRLLNCLLVLTFVAAAPALAQQEPPARVGRVSFVSGNLAFHMPGQSAWSAAGVNYPVATGTSLWTDAEARAELRIGPNTLAIAANTELDVTEVSEQATRISVPQGRVYLHLRQVDQRHSVKIDIPRGGVRLLQPGYYDIDAGTFEQPARVAVFEGSAQFVGGGTDIGIKPGDVAVLNGFSPVTAMVERAVADAFVEWCRSRDYDEKRLAAPYHISPDLTGYAELDSHGRWETAAGYGDVWYPDVPAGWAPYTDGRWAWIEPWGWTWVDDAPWGFAPSHYGRWAFIGERWCWVPGTFDPSPVYAPALVGFLGGPGVGLYVAGAVGPQVGWFALAPGEVYWPSYAAGPSYIRRVNGPNVANVDSLQIPQSRQSPAGHADTQFANRRFATVVPQHVFASAGQVGPVAVHPAASALQHAAVAMRQPQIRPAPVRSVPGPVTFGARGQPGAPPGIRGEHASGASRLPSPSNAAALPPPSGAGFGGHQPGQPTNTAALPLPSREGGVSAHGRMPQSIASQESHPVWPGATHSHAPAPVFHPPTQAFHPPPQAVHPPPQAPHLPAQAFHPPPQAPHLPAQTVHPPPQAPHLPAQTVHPPPQAPHPPAQAFHPPAQAPQQVAHAPPAAKGGAPPHGGGGKGDKHD